MRFKFSFMTASALGLFIFASSVSAQSLTGTYYIMSSGNTGQHIDHKGIDGNRVLDLVQTTLLNDRPVASQKAIDGGFASGPLEDRDLDNRLLWWTEGVRGNGSYSVTRDTGVGVNGVRNDSFLWDGSKYVYDSEASFFPTGANSNANGKRSVHWSGFFSTTSPGSVEMSVLADDDAWVFINGVLAIDNGGVKAFNNSFRSSLITTNMIVANEQNRIDIFFADRANVQARFQMESSVAFEPIPEPATMLTLGLGGALLAARRRRKA